MNPLGLRVGRLSAILLLCALSLAPALPNKTTVVKVVSVSPFGEQGVGLSIRNGTELAITRRASEFKKLGLELSFAAYDDQAKPLLGQQIAQQVLKDPQVFGVVGALNSSVSRVLAQAFAPSQLAIVSPTSTNSQLTQQGWRHFSRLVPPDQAQGLAAVSYITSRLDVSKVVVVSDNTTYGNGLCKSFIAALEQRQLKPSQYLGVSTPDQLAYLVKLLKNSDAQLIYYGGAEVAGATVVKAIRQAGVELPIMGGDGIDNSDFVAQVGPDARGVMYTTVFGPTSNFKYYTTFALMYKHAYKSEPDTIAVYSYDAANAILNSVKAAASAQRNQLTRERVSQELRQLKLEDCDSLACPNISGALSFSASGERALSKVMIMQYASNLKSKPLRYEVVKAETFEPRVAEGTP